MCLSVSHAFTDVFADAGALLPNGTTTANVSVVFEAKESGRAIVVVSFTREEEVNEEGELIQKLLRPNASFPREL